MRGFLGGVFVTWRKKVFKPQAVFVIVSLLHYSPEGITSYKDELLSLQATPPKSHPSNSDTATKELFEALQEDEALSSEWSVVFLDVQWSVSSCLYEKYNGKLEKRAGEFLKKLANSNIGQDRPVVWVGHKIGGLLIKSIINQAASSDEPAVCRIAENFLAVMFLGTPHRVSAIAKLKQHTSALVWPPVVVDELEENSTQLDHLNKPFLKTISQLKKKPKIVTVWEGSPTVMTSFKLPLLIVMETSARIDEGDFYLSKEDHLNLSM